MNEITYLQKETITYFRKRKRSYELLKRKLKRIRHEECFPHLEYNIEQLFLSMSPLYETNPAALKSLHSKKILNIQFERKPLSLPNNRSILNKQSYHNIGSSVCKNYWDAGTLLFTKQIINTNMGLVNMESYSAKMINEILEAGRSLLLVESKFIPTQKDIPGEKWFLSTISDNKRMSEKKGSCKILTECVALDCSKEYEKSIVSCISSNKDLTYFQDINVSYLNSCSILLSIDATAIMNLFTCLKNFAGFRCGSDGSDKCFENVTRFAKSIGFMKQDFKILVECVATGCSNGYKKNIISCVDTNGASTYYQDVNPSYRNSCRNSISIDATTIMNLFMGLTNFANFSSGYDDNCIKNATKCTESIGFIKLYCKNEMIKNTGNIKSSPFFETLGENVEINKSLSFAERPSNLKSKYSYPSESNCDNYVFMKQDCVNETIRNIGNIKNGPFFESLCENIEKNKSLNFAGHTRASALKRKYGYPSETISDRYTFMKQNSKNEMMRSNRNIKRSSFLETLLENIEINKSLNFAEHSHTSNLKRKHCYSLESNCDSLNVDPGDAAFPSHLNFKKFKWEVSGAMERPYGIQFPQRNSRNGELDARHADAEYDTISEIRNSKQISEIFARAATEGTDRRDEAKFLPEDEVEKTIINSNCYFGKNEKESSRKISMLSLESNTSGNICENFIDLPRGNTSAFDPFRNKNKKLEFPWKRFCGRLPLIASAKSVEESAKLVCSEREEQSSSGIHTDEKCLNESQQVYPNEDFFLNDETQSLGELFVLNIDKHQQDKSEINKNKFPGSNATEIFEKFRAVSVENKKDIGCQTETLPCFLQTAAELPHTSFKHETVENIEDELHLEIMDRATTEERQWGSTVSMTYDKHYSKPSYEELKTELSSDEFNEFEGNSQHIEQVVPNDGEKSKVRLGLSRQVKAKSLHPYLRRRANWFF